VHVSNTYFDLGKAPGVSQDMLVQPILIRGANAAGGAVMRGLKFSNCLIRGKVTAPLFGFGAFVNAFDEIRAITFTGCEFRLFQGPAIDLTTPAGFDAAGKLREVSVKGCLLVGWPMAEKSARDPGRGPGHLDLRQHLRRRRLDAGGPRPVEVGARARNVSVHGELFGEAARARRRTVS
jgi:hypothetical protein